MSTVSSRSTLLLVAALMALSGPGLSACVSHLQPTAPSAAAPLTQLPADIEVPPSTVQLVVPLDFDELNRLLDEALPQDVAGLRNIRVASGVLGSFSLQRAGQATLLANEGRLQIILPLHLDVEATWSTTVFGQSFGHTEHASTDFVIAVDTRLSADEEWNATTESTLDYRIASTDIGIGPIRLDLRELLDAQLRPHLGALRERVDQELGEALDLRGRMERLWPRVVEPMRVLEDPALFIRLVPSQVQWVRPRMVDGRFTFGLGVTTQVRSYMGAAPDVGGRAASAAAPRGRGPRQ